ncbi:MULTISPECIES: NADH-quinone oxidoreductase subunit L [unclassified Rhodococcus (in: high G+C Gram-positive bacteria)]|uniref:NADH-quinone oxidoreductase subunit L n=1 Tax=unclassified Rhodococcus (in: high G+C Gram-positive bacteria) TaxID=192944 RepID=UPI0007BAE915|nr:MULTISPECIES: NADH-quinone oxidoreductase subunit L [unclassified Rhodococcus (in: high G+C Gram-positive bacteria)]KZE99528.1 NADH-quinone oxidoreductase subunit L [Rhodococcus sp. EPR-279]KZF04106.1 NADH-quinone oxidoreductase subunit L [Rhodococcus sp. EPR-147]
MSILWLLPALPAFGAAFLLLGGRRCNSWGHLVATAAAVSSFVVAAVVFASMLGRDESNRMLTQTLFRWVPVDELQVDFGLRADQLSICFVLLITGVGSLIHVYSIGYMSHDAERRRFFAYLNLFLAAMLLLVLADNFLGLYLGWEGVGLASYLLIGFWQHKPSAASAARKAFVVNRVGDIGLAVALMIMFVNFGSVQYDDVFAGIGEASESVATAMALMLLLAACGKSAQVPLQSWLGDAMEGPTPVSALIHAATMVTAGVYLIVRSGPVFEASPTARAATVTVGAVTLLFGAVIGCAKDDIKKALAASTMSQIGYMVLAAGLGPSGYAYAIVLLISHGFFKAGLFLGAGSVMHAMNDETDMRRFGGLRAAMPITFVTFGLGYLAIIGLPPFSGFFAKDPIIEVAFAAEGVAGPILGCVTLLGAGLTAFYMTRVMLLTFFGPKRWSAQAHPHEATATMTVPMIVLAVGSVASGAFLAVGGRLEAWLEPVVGSEHEEHAIPAWLVTVAVLVVVLVGASIAYRKYIANEVPPTPPEDVSPLTRAARADLYGDAVNEAAFMRPGQTLTRALVHADNGIDAVVDGVGSSIGGASTRSGRLQTGYVRSYALAMFAGAVLVVLMVVAL